MRLVMFALGLAVLTGACGPDRPANPAADAPPLVETLVVTTASDGADTIRATGTVRARRETLLGFTSAGRIAAVLVDEGDRVRAGQLLARLDTDQVGAAESAARAEANRASADLARQRALFAKGWVTRARLEAAEATARSAAAQVTAARFSVDTARIVAPVDGVVLLRHAERDQVVAAGAPVVTLGEADGGYVLRVPLADRDLARVRIGAPVRVRLSALGTEAIAGSIIEIGGRGDARTGTFEAEVALPAIEGLRSGLIGDAEITAASGTTGTAAIVVPALAIFGARADEGFVYVLRDGRVRVRLVKLGETTDAGVHMLGGLAAGERIVASGIERLRDGMAVRVAGR